MQLPWKLNELRSVAVGVRSSDSIAACTQQDKENMKEDGYNRYSTDIEGIRKKEYPHLKGQTYLDHSGTTIYATSLIKNHFATLQTELFGNPHSANPSSTHSAKVEKTTRRAVLEFFNADPDVYDIVFTANATAALKLVGESLSGLPSGFKYRVHRDAHTSLTGVRQYATQFSYFQDDLDVERWLTLNEDTIDIHQISTPSTSANSKSAPSVGLFAYPIQSNFDGRRLSQSWPKTIVERKRNWLTLIDAAAYAMTAPLDIDKIQPDFVAVSFYKIFGYPDLGALIIRRSAAGFLKFRRYFGGGTIQGLLLNQDWHELVEGEPHEFLEDGTLPFHQIAALGEAIKVHERIFGNMQNISRHVMAIARYAHAKLQLIRHHNGQPLLRIYSDAPMDPETQGGIITFNVYDEDGAVVSFLDVEQELAKRKIHVRAGRHCNLGGIYKHLQFDDDYMTEAYKMGSWCRGDTAVGVLDGRPIGVIRASFGAMSTVDDVLCLIKALKSSYLQRSGGGNDSWSYRSTNSNSWALVSGLCTRGRKFRKNKPNEEKALEKVLV